MNIHISQKNAFFKTNVYQSLRFGSRIPDDKSFFHRLVLRFFAEFLAGWQPSFIGGILKSTHKVRKGVLSLSE
jgi:hypothetical protein